ncbi:MULTISPECIES: copper resistance CopC family protein [unclassified Pseudonocardia]|uniref:copper resistance CopC family protein n=1 Tax=unclassified Pseudonocardia TaxID=2619320 RepID=UPI00094AD1D4|nr:MULTISPECIES: copper resistance CopC family protein [unclassified Pseudonocardia]OLL84284.1 Copper resistance protein D [Pseudonocardia sp. Ae263_Ps1]
MRPLLPTLRRAAVVLPAVLLAVVLGAAPAWAHTELESSTPAADAQVADAPTTVTLTFSEEIPAHEATVTVRGPDGAAYAAGPATGDGATLTVPLRPLGPAGAYTVDYRVVSDDGHPVAGTVPFTLTRPGPGAAATTPAPAAAPGAEAPGSPAPEASAAPAAAESGDGAPVWPWILAAVVVIGGGAVVALRRAKS